MISPISSTTSLQIAGTAFESIRQAAQGFAKLWSASDNESPTEQATGISTEKLLTHRFEDLLKELGIERGQSLSIEIDDTGDIWVQDDLGRRSLNETRGISQAARLEAAIAEDNELKELLVKWGNEHSPHGSAFFHWPRSQ
jgi:hypothetical protein